jgi:chromosome partitioning protein
MILALINSKGGVAKTTSAVNLAAGLASLGHPTLLVDLDSQCSAALSLGVTREDLLPSSANVLLDGMPIRQAIRPTAIDSLSLLTASIELANADLALSQLRGREERLKAALAPIRNDYRYIILDCPPSLSLLPINALIASDAFIVPVVPQYLALEGLLNLLETVETIRQNMNARSLLLGLLLTLVDYRAKVTADIIERIRKAYGKQVFETEIRVNIRLAEAPSFGESIFDYDRSSTGAHAYRSLALEVVKRAKSKHIK